MTVHGHQLIWPAIKDSNSYLDCNGLNGYDGYVVYLIAKNPEIGLKREELTEGLRSFPVGHHIAYYVERSGNIELARILHPAMDTEKAMKK